MSLDTSVGLLQLFAGFEICFVFFFGEKMVLRSLYGVRGATVKQQQTTNCFLYFFWLGRCDRPNKETCVVYCRRCRTQNCG